jgi:hypothetical protein
MELFDYRSKKWRRLSQAVQRRAGWRCEACGRTKLEIGALGQQLVTHHRLDAQRFPEFALDPMLLLSCCEECHESIHGRVLGSRAPPGQLDFWPVALQIDSDLQAFDDQGRQAKIRAAENRVYAREWRRLLRFDRMRAVKEANEIAEAQRQKYRELGVLEDYSESGTIHTDGEIHGTAITETTRSRRSRSP